MSRGRSFFAPALLYLTVILTAASPATAADTVRTPFAGVTWTHRVTATQNIHIMAVDLTHPQVRIGTGLAQNAVSGRGTTSSIARAKGAQIAINADFCNLTGAYAGVPQNVHVENGVIKTNPRYRTAIGFTATKQARMGFWVGESPPQWTWNGRLRTQSGLEHPLMHMGKDVVPGWIVVYSHDFKPDGTTLGNTYFTDGTEVIVDGAGVVVAKRINQPSYPVPTNGYCYIGRGNTGEWLQNNIQVGETVTFIPESTPRWQDYQTLVGGGPAIAKNGQVYSDPIQEYPNGEDHTLSYKQTYYNSLHPRSLIGLSADRKTLYLVAVDGRAASLGREGMTLAQAGELMLSLGAWEAVSMDGGGSVTLYVESQGVVNYPSDGSERAISNALLVFADPAPQPTFTPGPPSWAETGGLAVCEAENCNNKVAQGGHEWNFYGGSFRPGWVGTGYMRAEPDSGTVRQSDFIANAPRMDYRIHFASGGTCSLWARVQNDGTSDDTVHFGLDGSAQPTGLMVVNAGATGQWVWTRTLGAGGNAALTIPSSGMHVVSVWMCEDGARIDRFLLVRDAGYVPSGEGPAETLYGAETPTYTPTQPPIVPTATPTRTNTPSPTATRTLTPTVTPTPAPDLDGDSIPDSLEGYPPQVGQTSRLLPDSDGDGLDDGTEDGDRNGQHDLWETNPRNADTDGDALMDGIEVRVLATDPLYPAAPGSYVDADGDGLPAPLDFFDAVPDSDGDRFLDGYEAAVVDLNAVYEDSIRPSLGDTNRDGQVSNVDALMVQSLFLGIVGPDTPAFLDTGYRYSDANRDGQISNVDALVLQSFFLAAVPSLPLPGNP